MNIHLPITLCFIFYARWTRKGVPTEDQVWFENWWMVASLCDE
jgi:hypothetical protein